MHWFLKKSQNYLQTPSGLIFQFFGGGMNDGDHLDLLHGESMDANRGRLGGLACLPELKELFFQAHGGGFSRRY